MRSGGDGGARRTAEEVEGEGEKRRGCMRRGEASQEAEQWEMNIKQL